MALSAFRPRRSVALQRRSTVSTEPNSFYSYHTVGLKPPREFPQALADAIGRIADGEPGDLADFAHLHARTGTKNSYREFMAILDKVEAKLGRQALDNMHMHVSGIGYGKSGETKHLTFEEADFQYQELLQALRDRDVQGTMICESPTLEEDALLLQQTYRTC